MKERLAVISQDSTGSNLNDTHNFKYERLIM